MGEVILHFFTKSCPFFDLEFSKCSSSRALAPACCALVFFISNSGNFRKLYSYGCRNVMFQSCYHGGYTCLLIMGVILVCLPMLSTDPVQNKVAVNREFSRKQYQ